MTSIKPKYYDIDGNLISVGDIVEFQDNKHTAIISENEIGEMTIQLAVKDFYMNRRRSKNLKIIKED